MGFISMKALSGGLITNSAAAYAFQAQFDHVLPIWGVQREKELDEFLSYIDHPPKMTEDLEAIIAKDKEDLAGTFCRGCGYCMPCPVGLEINNCASQNVPTVWIRRRCWKRIIKIIRKFWRGNRCKKWFTYS